MPPPEPIHRPAGIPVVVPYGDAAVLIDLGLPASPATSRLVRALVELLGREDPPVGWERPVPGASSVLVPVDPADPGAAAAAAAIRARVSGWVPTMISADSPAGRDPLEIPVRYGGDAGPDLDEVAARTGLPPADVIRLHAGTTYSAAFVGFAPGFAYLEPLPEALRLPRLAAPRSRLPAGSVAIAGPYTAIYPADSPGGWWIIGRTDRNIWDPRCDPPSPLTAGRVVRFVPT